MYNRDINIIVLFSFQQYRETYLIGFKVSVLIKWKAVWVESACIVVRSVFSAHSSETAGSSSLTFSEIPNCQTALSERGRDPVPVV